MLCVKDTNHCHLLVENCLNEHQAFLLFCRLLLLEAVRLGLPFEVLLPLVEVIRAELLTVSPVEEDNLLMTGFFCFSRMCVGTVNTGRFKAPES